MSYIPTNWQTGDIVTAEKLNKLENGVSTNGGGGILTLTRDTETGALDKTWKEIYDAIVSKKLPIIFLGESYDVGLSFIISAFRNIAPPNFETVYCIEVSDLSDSATYLYKASSEDDYPVVVEDIEPA